MSLTRILDTDQLVLLTLPLEDLTQACATNRQLYQVCQDPYFWRRRLNWEYGIEPPNLQKSKEYYYQLLTMSIELLPNGLNETYWRNRILYEFGPDVLAHKPVESTYLEQYKYITNESLQTMIKDGRVDGLIINQQKGVYPSFDLLVEAPLNVLKWYYQANNYLPAGLFNSKDHWTRFQFFQTIPGYILLENYRHYLAMAMKNGNEGLVDYLYKTEGIIPSNEDVESAYRYYQWEVLNYLYQHGIRKPTHEDVDLAAEYTPQHLLEVIRLSGGLQPSQKAVDQITNIDVLKKLSILPGQSGINNAVESGKIDTVIWINQQTGLIPGQLSIDQSANDDDLAMIQFLHYNLNLLPSHHLQQDLMDDYSFSEVGEWLRDSM